MLLTKSAGIVISDAPVRNLEGLGRLQYIALTILDLGLLVLKSAEHRYTDTQTDIP